MKGKAAFVLGAGVGYVLGTRAGREQYERIARGARAVWGHPIVQTRVSGLEDRASEIARAQSAAVIDKLAETAKNLVQHGTFSASAAQPAARSTYDSTATPLA